ncbi:hypothetical protein SDJN03_07524, partial [Cucurbita argyrosperma subsp. sororia]
MGVRDCERVEQEIRSRRRRRFGVSPLRLEILEGKWEPREQETSCYWALKASEDVGGLNADHTITFGHEEEEEAGIELDPLAQILGTL